MSNQHIDHDAVLQRVDQKIRHERLWFAHLIVFLIYLAAATTGQVYVNGILLIGWATLLFVHQTWVNSIGRREKLLEEAIRREEQILSDDADEKPKREGEYLVLEDDGELVEFPTDSQDEKVKRS